MARFLATAVVLSSGLASGCLDNDGPDPGHQIFQASLDLWNEEGPDSYVMVLRRQTIGINPDVRVIITVQNDVVVSRIYDGTDIPVSEDAAAGISRRSGAVLDCAGEHGGRPVPALDRIRSDLRLSQPRSRST